jgi:PAS domain S-box-containing protein
MQTRIKIYLFFSLKCFIVYTALTTLIVFGFLGMSQLWIAVSYFSLIGSIFTGGRVLYDVYESQLAERTQFEEKYCAIDRSSLVVTFNSDGTIKDLNENMGFLLGYKSHELVGKHHRVLVPSREQASPSYKFFWKELSDGNYVEGQFQRIAKDGSLVWISASYMPIKDKDGKVYQVIKIAQDITERVQSQLEIVRQNAYLEHAAKILRHDMHSGINTYMPRGLRSLRRRLPEERIKELKIDAPIRLIEEGLAHTQKVYKGVYEFTNLVKPHTELDREIINIEDALRDYLSSTAYKDQVALDRLPLLKVNEPLFCTAIDNLIRNGLKYNDSDFKMVAITMIDDNHLGVIDNGRGMTQKDFEEYCKPYFRKKDQKEAGTGLGLNISMAILKEHGFSVSVRHDPNRNEGTTIRIKVR